MEKWRQYKFHLIDNRRKKTNKERKKKEKGKRKGKEKRFPISRSQFDQSILAELQVMLF